MGKTDRGRGALTSTSARNDILLLIADAVAAGCRQNEACDAINIECRTFSAGKKTL
jgi:sulfur transfer complex TusBCD TusB component (DsrH family)